MKKHFLVTLCLALVATSCASKLEREKTLNRPEGQVQAVDLSLVNFLDIQSGETVNVASYMEEHQKDFLLITFGSRGCSACNEKGSFLRDNVIGQHPFFATEEGQRFEIVGINTDPDPMPRVRQFVLTYRFGSFMRWNDPRGKAMIEFFMPSGRAFGVPLTVMLSRRGIHWSVTNDQAVSVDELMKLAEDTVKGGDARPRPKPSPSASPTPTPTPTASPTAPPLPPPTGLDVEAAGRLQSVKVRTCAGEQTDVGALLGERDYYVIQAEGTTCDGACQANRLQISDLATRCAASRDGARSGGCGVLSLSQATLDSTLCAAGITASGGSEFFASFKNHFNWDNPVFEVYEPAWQMGVAPVVGPLTFIFNGQGRLVYSHEGQLAEGALSSFVAAGDFTKRATGPDFPFYGARPAQSGGNGSRGNFSLSALTPHTRYTIVNAYGTFCGSCIEEMAFWSRPGQLKEFCANNPNDCQVLVVNSDYPAEGQSYDQFLDEAQVTLQGSGIDFPLAFDPVNPNEDGGTLKRFFSGYLLGEFFDAITAGPPVDKRGDPRTVIYDPEGRIVGMYLAEGVHDPEQHVDPVLSRIRELVGK